MRIATLVTNTDLSDFAHAHDLDDVKFAQMIQWVRPDWQVDGFDVHRGIFPEDLAAYDGVMITGSPASVNDDLPWIARLKRLVADILRRRQKLFGACFGHQVIADTLGAAVIRNPGGWGHGRIPVTMTDPPHWVEGVEIRSLYGSHSEQVASAPPGTRVIAASPGCPIAGLRMGDHLYTTQHHPEMDDAFIAALVEEMADYVGAEVTAAARASLASGRADSVAFAETVARFFEG